LTRPNVSGDAKRVSARAAAVAPEGFAEGIRQFNSWMFYDCHETLEDIWRETGAKGDDATLANFYQGIIKAAAGYHHLLRNNYRGAMNLLSDTFRLLEPYRPETLGVDVDRLLMEVRASLERIKELGHKRLAEFERSRIPVIAFDAGSAQPPASARQCDPSADSG
jgi:predicted metal-dependent hydrolase